MAALFGFARAGFGPCFLGRGFVESAHGRIPVPAPATALLLRGAPVELGDVKAELTTPTGAALLATLVEDWGPPPAFRLGRVGTGAGARDLEGQANVLRLMVGETETAGGGGLSTPARTKLCFRDRRARLQK